MMELKILLYGLVGTMIIVVLSVLVVLYPKRETQPQAFHLVTSSNDSGTQILTSEDIHVVICADTGVLKGLVALLQSINVHTKQNTTIHIIVNGHDELLIRNTIICSLDQMNELIQIDVIVFNLPQDFQTLINVMGYNSYLSSPMNFVRFFISRLLPDLAHVLYLDTDTIVRHDLRELWTQVVNNDKLLLVIPREFTKYHLQLKNEEKFYDAFYKKYGKEYVIGKYDFNAGVVGFNLNKWRTNNVTEDVKYWMEQNHKYSLWGLGTQPVLNIISYDDWKGTDKKWNVRVTRKMVPGKSDCLLHWNSREIKPWFLFNQRNHEYATSVWMKYYKEVCSGKGHCNAEALCECESGYTGHYCEELTT